MKIQDLAAFKNHILAMIILLSIGLVSLSTLVDIHLKGLSPSIIVNTGAVLILVIAYFTRSKWMKYKQIRLILVLFFAFVFLPIDWVVSIGVTGVIPYYAMILILFSSLFLDQEPMRLFVPIGIVIEISLFFMIERNQPDFFQSGLDSTKMVDNLMLNFLVASLALISLVFLVYHYLEKHLEELYKISITDSLTEVYNRRYVFKRLEDIANHAKRMKEPFYLLYVDMDHFKRINDKFGHHTGDEILKIMGEILRNNLRSYDIPSRIGGDEFLIILPDTQYKAAKEVADRIVIYFSQYVKERLKVEATLSIGIAEGSNKDITELLKEADGHMYAQKSLHES